MKYESNNFVTRFHKISQDFTRFTRLVMLCDLLQGPFYSVEKSTLCKGRILCFKEIKLAAMFLIDLKMIDLSLSRCIRLWLDNFVGDFIYFYFYFYFSLLPPVLLPLTHPHQTFTQSIEDLFSRSLSCCIFLSLSLLKSMHIRWSLIRFRFRFRLYFIYIYIYYLVLQCFYLFTWFA